MNNWAEHYSNVLAGYEHLKIAAAEAPITENGERRTRNGKFTLRQLRQTDGIVPLQSGTNQFDSQKVLIFFAFFEYLHVLWVGKWRIIFFFNAISVYSVRMKQ